MSFSVFTRFTLSVLCQDFALMLLFHDKKKISASMQTTGLLTDPGSLWWVSERLLWGLHDYCNAQLNQTKENISAREKYWFKTAFGHLTRTRRECVMTQCTTGFYSGLTKTQLWPCTDVPFMQSSLGAHTGKWCIAWTQILWEYMLNLRGDKKTKDRVLECKQDGIVILPCSLLVFLGNT